MKGIKIMIKQPQIEINNPKLYQMENEYVTPQARPNSPIILETQQFSGFEIIK